MRPSGGVTRAKDPRGGGPAGIPGPRPSTGCGARRRPATTDGPAPRRGDRIQLRLGGARGPRCGAPVRAAGGPRGIRPGPGPALAPPLHDRGDQRRRGRRVPGGPRPGPLGRTPVGPGISRAPSDSRSRRRRRRARVGGRRPERVVTPRRGHITSSARAMVVCRAWPGVAYSRRTSVVLSAHGRAARVLSRFSRVLPLALTGTEVGLRGRRQEPWASSRRPGSPLDARVLHQVASTHGAGRPSGSDQGPAHRACACRTRPLGATGDTG